VRDWYVAWIEATRAGTPVGEDLVRFAFVLTMALLMWLLSYICTWFVVRYASWWGAVLPSGFALVFNLYQSPPDRLSGLAFFLLCALLLAQQTHTALQLDRWRREHIGYSPGIGLDFLRDGLVVAVVVIGLGWFGPSQVSSEPLHQVLARFARTSDEVSTRFNRLFPSLAYPARGGGGSAFGTTLPLGGSVALGQQAVFEARVVGAQTAPRYWRLAVFDTYDGQGWRRSTDTVLTGKEFDLHLADDALMTVPVTQTIRTFLARTEQLYALPQPDGFDAPIQVEVARGDGVGDVMAVGSPAALSLGSRYEAVSRQSVATVELLRAADGPDPSWVSERYLAIPSGVPERVGALAQQITRGSENRFDAAERIEAYLRGFPYSEVIDDPPPDGDRVDWFLFEEQRGYCDYYSSAFVILARSVGIPARLAAGYSTGTYVAAADTYRQHESDAHTWPEAYFPSYGWIEFEPTASDAPLPRPEAAEEGDAPAEDPLAEPGRSFEEPRPDEGVEQPAPVVSTETAPPALPWRRRLTIGLGIAALLLAGIGVLAVAWQRPFRHLTVAQGVFARLTRVATWLGLGARAADTPHEYARRLGGEIPDGRAEIDTIVDVYVQERFGRRPSGGQAMRLWGSWQRLRPSLAVAGLRLLTRRLGVRRRR